MYTLKYLKYIILLISAYLICGNGFATAVPHKSYAASTAQLLELLELEDRLVENLHDYVEKLKEKLLLVENSLETMRAANNLMNEDYEEYLGNPINSFSLMLRVRRGWRKWLHYTSNPNNEELDHIKVAHRLRKLLPSARDLDQAYRGIDDLVDFYDLKPADLAAGTLSGISQPETALTAQDCFGLAEFCVSEQKDDRAEAWFNASLAKITTQKEDKLADQLYGFSSFSVHNSWGALLMKNKRTTEGLRHFRQKPKGSPESFLFRYFAKLMAVKQNCSAVFQRPSHLHCHYNTTATPFVRIAPFKVEVLSLDPYLVVYHDVVYESEIDWMLNVSEFRTSLVGHGYKSPIRSSKGAGSSLMTGKVFDTITTRATDMTGLSMDLSGKLSLVNYGLGGHFDLHYDFFTDHEVRQKRGGRLVTLLFYVGDVELGGDTVFPYINVKVSPKKGSAVMWYNLHNSGDMNIRTPHSACPVIVGSKYVLTKWINEIPQTFATPCMKDANKHPENDTEEEVFRLN